jgi:putative FmdB family regulatory protein
MPLYDYRCRSCGHEFEVLVRGDAGTLSCARCASVDVERLPSMFAVNTEGTRQASLGKARKANLGVERDKAIANEEYINKHHD